MNDKYTHKNGIVYLNQYHIVFCPKYRRKVLIGSIEKDLTSPPGSPHPHGWG